MAEITKAMMYELLKRMQADITDISSDMRDVKHDLHAMRGTMIAMQQDIHGIYGILHRSGDCLDRIERGLDRRDSARKAVQTGYQPQ
jgi:hypothetical protein